MSAALRYRPEFETPEPDEAETNEQLAETMRGIQEKTLEDGHGALRAVHAKSHGLLRGELQVLSGLPETLAQGLFATAATYPVVVRLSTNPGDLLDDSVSVPRGLAIKVLGVPGARLPGSEGDTTQDFVLVNGPAFLKKDGKSFASSLKLLAGTTDKAPGLKKVLSAVLRGTERLIESVGGEAPNLIALGGQPMTHLLGDTYFSQTPFLYGDYMAKFSLAPLSAELTALTDQPLELKGRPNGLREAVVDFFSRHEGEWALRVQLCNDLDAMPIEDAKAEWSEEQSPFLTVARIRLPAQEGWSEARSRAIDDGLSFSPWHGLAAHRPLGSVNRLRRHAYEHARQFRSAHNGCPLHEPKAVDGLAD